VGGTTCRLVAAVLSSASAADLTAVVASESADHRLALPNACSAGRPLGRHRSAYKPCPSAPAAVRPRHWPRAHGKLLPDLDGFPPVGLQVSRHITVDLDPLLIPIVRSVPPVEKLSSGPLRRRTRRLQCGGRGGLGRVPLARLSAMVDPVAEELLRLRMSIDNMDAALVHLLAERFKITQQVGELKAAHGLPPADPVREAQQIERLRALAEDARLDPEFAEKFLNFVVAEVVRHHEAAMSRSNSGDP
jgi:chorismate mutase